MTCWTSRASGRTALYYAAVRGFSDACEMLLSAGANAAAGCGSPAGTALHAACRYFHVTCTVVLADCVVCCVLGRRNGQLEVVQSLVAARCDVNAVDAMGSTPLFAAVEQVL